MCFDTTMNLTHSHTFPAAHTEKQKHLTFIVKKKKKTAALLASQEYKAQSLNKALEITLHDA